MRWEAQVWRLYVDRDTRELVSAHSTTEEDYALESAGRYAEQYATKGYELTPEELPGGTRILRATKGDEVFVIQVEAKER